MKMKRKHIIVRQEIYYLISCAAFREARIRATYTKTELAEKLGVSKSYITHLENGTGNLGPISYEKIKEIEEILGARLLC